MKVSKLFGGLAVAAASLFLLSACGSSSSEDTSVSDIKDKGTLVVALNPEFAPFEFKTLVDGKDTIVGADVEIAKAIAEELGVDVKFSSMSFNNVLASLQSGKADIAISGISATEEKNVRKLMISQILIMKLRMLFLSEKQMLINIQIQTL